MPFMALVELITWTENPEKVVYIAARRCASGKPYYKLMEEYELATDEEVQEFIRKVIARGHLSVLEHVSFTYHIDGISRACSHQLVRHRLMSVSQMSQRRVQQVEFVCPDGLDTRQNALYESALASASRAYEQLLEMGVPKEDARFVLPEATATAMVVTVNARELLHIVGERACSKAQWEIQALARRMADLAGSAWPLLGEYLGPKCLALGRCPEKDGPCEHFQEKVRERKRWTKRTSR